MPLIDVTDEVLLLRMRTFEDVFVERKTVGDHKDWLKTAVAFANTAPEGYPCVLYIGVRNNGEIEEHQSDLDAVQKKFNYKLSVVYPPIPYLPRVIHDHGRQALAVIIWGSAIRPHFSGHAYVRKGSESVPSDGEQYGKFIAQRNSIVQELLKYKGRSVDVYDIEQGQSHLRGTTNIFHYWHNNPIIESCNQFYVTLRVGNSFRSIPLGRIELSYAHERDTLRLDVHEIAVPRH